MWERSLLNTFLYAQDYSIVEQSSKSKTEEANWTGWRAENHAGFTRVHGSKLALLHLYELIMRSLFQSSFKVMLLRLNVVDIHVTPLPSKICISYEWCRVNFCTNNLGGICLQMHATWYLAARLSTCTQSSSLSCPLGAAELFLCPEPVTPKFPKQAAF